MILINASSMTKNILAVMSISKEILKNMLMGNALFRFFRTKVTSGRTTGYLNSEAAFHHCYQIVDQYKKGLQDAGLPSDYFENKSILEIGPGANLSVQLCFILEGAFRAYALDRFPEVRKTYKEVELYGKLINHSHTQIKANSDAFYSIVNQSPVFKEEKIRYFDNCSLENAYNIFYQEFDIVVSHLAMEFVNDLSQGINSISRLIKPGGICIFRCNLKSFGVFDNDKQPLKLLNYSDKIWNWMFSNRGGTNRVRAYGYQKLLQIHHFKIISFVVLDSMHQDELDIAKPFFDDQFKKLSDDELSILEFRIVAQYQG